MSNQSTTLPVHSQLPVRRLLSPLRRFLEIESAAGGILLACTVVALVIANSPWADAFHHFWQTPIVISVGQFGIDRPLEFWINDGLMTIFFFVVGLEIKREMAGGELSEWRSAALPVVGALGGMIAPALVYLLLFHNGAAVRGWGVPMATDIAFVVGVLALFGPRVPAGLKVFLLALAIADDIGAVLVIAFAYTDQLAWSWLLCGIGGLGLALAMRWLGARLVPVYFVIGIGIWHCFLAAGVHPTVAGVLLGLMTPVRPLLSLPTLRASVSRHLDRLRGEDEIESGKQRALLSEIAWAAHEAVSPLERLEHALHPVVSFLIMPLFALANAGVAIDGRHLNHPVALAVVLGLLVGKPLGIVLFSRLAVRFGLARLPVGVDWRQIVAAGCLGGIGFTMAIFIAGLAFEGSPDLLMAAKAGTLSGSVLAAALGALLLWRSTRLD